MREIKPTRESSIVYFQIGLIAALLLAIFVIENKSEIDNLNPETAEFNELDPETPFVFHMPKKQPEKIAIKKEKKKSTEKLPVKSSESPVETLDPVEPEKPTEPVKKEVGKMGLEKPIEAKIEEFNFRVVEMVPVFPGCEIYKTEAEIRNCFSSQIAKMIKKKFDGDLAAELDLHGEQRIYVKFTINELGLVENIRTRSVNEILAKEAKRVVELLPQMKPAQQQDKKVSVNYSLPIIFDIH
ncbi:energy transducer TonB [Mesonia sp. MT50]|uniref:Energy transducer TonB n=1 Tax=Mesonia profundi TaxID=3070998 RepID=A0ABU1A020_9FLAO|nr:energy transducer TonB [Mesonia profundi]MDQ7917007.1 energy transducer TonB [Mesonia profundi]